MISLVFQSSNKQELRAAVINLMNQNVLSVIDVNAAGAEREITRINRNIKTIHLEYQIGKNEQF